MTYCTLVENDVLIESKPHLQAGQKLMESTLVRSWLITCEAKDKWWRPLTRPMNEIGWYIASVNLDDFESFNYQGILLLKGLTCRPRMSNCVELVRTVTCNVPRYIAAFWAMGLNTSCWLIIDAPFLSAAIWKGAVKCKYKETDRHQKTKSHRYSWCAKTLSNIKRRHLFCRKLRPQNKL